MKLNVKPLSVNALYSGRRFKTEKYKAYSKELTYLLSVLNVPDGPLELYVTFGLSNKRQDLDGCFKGFIDILQSKYDFDDNRIYKITSIKEIVKKGNEFISFSLINYIECDF